MFKTGYLAILCKFCLLIYLKSDMKTDNVSRKHNTFECGNHIAEFYTRTNSNVTMDDN